MNHRLARAAALLVLLAACDGGSEVIAPPPPTPPPPLTPVQYLLHNAVRMRSIEIADADFSDLQPLKAMIGDARIVSLGEATHGDGATFQAKARLVRFLHAEMGFDVLAWEAGFWDVPRAWTLVEGGGAIMPSMRHGMSRVWSRSAEAEPVLSYVASTGSSSRPMALVGFDMQFTWDYDVSSLAPTLPGELRSLLERHGSSAADDPHFATLEAEVARMTGDWPTNKPDEAERAAFASSLSFLRGELTALGGGSGAGELAYGVQLLESLESLFEGQRVLTPALTLAERTAYANIRDRQMARNLAWYANRAFPGRRIIVWAATGHVMRNASAFEGFAPGTIRSMGDHLHDAFGEGVYAIGFTSHTGNWGIAGQPTVNLQPMGASSLEARFVDAGIQLGIVDLRNPAAGGSWLAQPFLSRPVRHLPREYGYRQSLDALVFIQSMTRSTEWVPGN